MIFIKMNITFPLHYGKVKTKDGERVLFEGEILSEDYLLSPEIMEYARLGTVIAKNGENVRICDIIKVDKCGRM